MPDFQIQNLSLTARILVNTEALNMAESVGNYTRHRKAPIVIPSENGYSILYAPVVSGESLAHAYQGILAQIASQRGLPVTQMDLHGYFMKFADKNIIKSYYSNDLAKILGLKKEDPKEIEEEVVKILEGYKNPGEIERLFVRTSVVADVGGFLYTTKTEEKTKKSSKKTDEGEEKVSIVKRTSPIRFAYLIPAIDALITGGVSIYPQLHVRYTPGAKEKEQALFYVESGSALYTLTAQLVISDIGKISMDPLLKDEELEKQRPNRIDAAVDALIMLVDGVLFGAKRSRYLPQWEVRSLLASFSRGPVEFNVTPGLSKDYMAKTYERAVFIVRALENKMVINMYAYNGETGYLEEPKVNTEIKNVTFEKAGSPAEALYRVKEKIMLINKPLR